MSSYPEEIKKFIAANVSGTTSNKLTEKINEKFNTDYKLSQIRAYMKNHKLKNGLITRFEKGQEPSNKGKKGQWAKGCEKTWFKKGNLPKQHRPIGSERIDAKDGYTLVKTAEPRKWELKHKVIWKSHYGDIPKGYAVIFLDGDKTNLDINNLKLIKRAELLIMNKRKLISTQKELTETGILIAKVIDKRNKRRKEVLT